MTEESDYTSIQQHVLEQDPMIAARDEAAIKSLPEDLGSAIGSPDAVLGPGSGLQATP